MNAFEKILLALLATASVSAPIFVHSPNGIAVLNVSEALFANILSEFAPKPPAVPAA